jgi:large subunit ribosomal protein L22e
MSKAKRTTFVLDLTEPHNEHAELIDSGLFATYLRERIKVDGVRNNLGTRVVVDNNDTTVSVTAEMPFSKRQLKYLAKKFLKKEELRDYLHVIATNPTTYKFRFFKVTKEAE